jgi:hypothetical protein
MKKMLVVLMVAVALSSGCAALREARPFYAGAVGQVGLHKGAVAVDTGGGLDHVLNGGTMDTITGFEFELFNVPLGAWVLYGAQEQSRFGWKFIVGGDYPRNEE